MKKLISIMMLLSLTMCFVACNCDEASAQTAPDNYLKVKGKILDGNTADIMVFAEDGGTWTKVRSMKSRKSYSVKLNPEENYNIVFTSADGIKKVMKVEAGNTGMWIMHLDINFKEYTVKYARMYQVGPDKDYALALIHKDNQRIVIGKTNTTTQETGVLSELRE
jgi:hypothetical protein